MRRKKQRPVSESHEPLPVVVQRKHESSTCDELRQLAHAIKALAESNQGIGGVLREEVAGRIETNRILALIHDQNAMMLDEMRMFNRRALESERLIRVLQSELKSHDQRIVTLESTAGLASAE